MAHIPANELKQMLAEASTKVNLGGKYFHYKHPEQYYTLVGVIVIEATDTIGVLYRAEYDPLQGVTFMRPIEDFLATVEVGGEEKERFSLVG